MNLGEPASGTSEHPASARKPESDASRSKCQRSHVTGAFTFHWNVAPDGRFRRIWGALLTGKICQSHSLKVSYSDQLWVSLKVTSWHERVETKGVLSKSTSDFRHLGLWHFECDS
jgi:hypothetical protein